MQSIPRGRDVRTPTREQQRERAALVHVVDAERADAGEGKGARVHVERVGRGLPVEGRCAGELVREAQGRKLLVEEGSRGVRDGHLEQLLDARCHWRTRGVAWPSVE